MKVKILVSRQGPGVSDDPGDVRDVDDAEAQRMFAAGEAEPYAPAAKRKAAKDDADKVETTAK